MVKNLISSLMLAFCFLFAQTSYAADSTHIASDFFIEASIDSLGEIDIYTFNGQSGDHIILRMLSSGNTNFDSLIELFGPADTLLVSARDTDPGFPIRQATLVYQLSRNGVYTFYAREVEGDQISQYSLMLENLSVNPIIEFTHVPGYGTTENMAGRVNVFPGNFEVALYIFVEGEGWWTKPTLAGAAIPIQHDSTWTADITTGGSDVFATRIHAFLIPKGTFPPPSEGLPCLPPTIYSVSVADKAVQRTPRTISFAEGKWYVKASVDKVSPGPNYFSDSMENVWVDDNDNLHLKITLRNGKWYCPEVILTNSLGYGKYIFQVVSPLGQLNENVVFGLFTWDNDACTENHREIDIEFSRWGNRNDLLNAQYVVQPHDITGNLSRWMMPSTVDTSTHVFDWKGDKVAFTSMKGLQSTQPYHSVIYTWNYTGADIPNPGSENCRINLWLLNSRPPSDGQEVEVILIASDRIVSVNQEPAPVLNRYYLSQNYPNPFNPTTQIRFGLAKTSKVRIVIHNILGQEVVRLFEGQKPPGQYIIDFDADRLGSGIYFYTIHTDEFTQVRKMLLIR